MNKLVWALAWFHSVYTQKSTNFTIDPSKVYNSLMTDYKVGHLTEEMIKEDISAYLLLQKH